MGRGSSWSATRRSPAATRGSAGGSAKLRRRRSLNAIQNPRRTRRHAVRIDAARGGTEPNGHGAATRRRMSVSGGIHRVMVSGSRDREDILEALSRESSLGYELFV
jgi:hypothetical protein